MLTANVCGWSPAVDDDEVVHDVHFMAPKPFTSSLPILGPFCPPLGPPPPKICPPQPTPLSPLTRVSHSPVAPSSDRRAQSKRNRDPSWIPRPRNAFIIFRCEYSREHSQSSQESQNDTDSNPSVKTLSKRAADAWKELPATEKDRYKILAEREREEHARLYPHYRFRPMKRQASGTRKMSCERPQPARVASQERPPASSPHLPSVLSSAPTKSRSNAPVERPDVILVPPVMEAPIPEPSPCSTDFQTNIGVPLSLDFDDDMLFYSSPEATLPSETSPAASAELFPSSLLCSSTFGNDPTFGLDLSRDDPERAQDLEAYAMGLYDYDLFSPFAFKGHS